MTTESQVKQGGGVLPRRFEIFDQMLALFPAGRLVDLGAGHGMFAQRAAEAGWVVTAVDARPDRFPKDSSVKWLTQDVRLVDLSPYDVIACLGLFYHLTPEDQVSLVRRAGGKPIIIDTHVDNGLSTHPLSERMVVDGYEGSWYREPGELTSSWGNRRSFWPTPESLYQMLRECGYPGGGVGSALGQAGPDVLSRPSRQLRALQARSRLHGHTCRRTWDPPGSPPGTPRRTPGQACPREGTQPVAPAPEHRAGASDP